MSRTGIYDIAIIYGCSALKGTEMSNGIPFLSG